MNYAKIQFHFSHSFLCFNSAARSCTYSIKKFNMGILFSQFFRLIKILSSRENSKISNYSSQYHIKESKPHISKKTVPIRIVTEKKAPSSQYDMQLSIINAKDVEIHSYSKPDFVEP